MTTDGTSNENVQARWVEPCTSRLSSSQHITLNSAGIILNSAGEHHETFRRRCTRQRLSYRRIEIGHAEFRKPFPSQRTMMTLPLEANGTSRALVFRCWGHLVGKAHLQAASIVDLECANNLNTVDGGTTIGSSAGCFDGPTQSSFGREMRYE